MEVAEHAAGGATINKALTLQNTLNLTVATGL